MSKNQLVALVIIAGLFLVVFLVQQVSKSKPDLATEMELQALAPDGFLVSDVSRVELSRGSQEPALAADGGEGKEAKQEDETGKVVLVRNEDGWSVKSAYQAPGQKDKVEEFLKKLKDLKGEYRSDDASVLADYDLDGDKALHVAAYGQADGDPWFHLLVGKKEAYGRSFVRLAGEDTVYTIGLNLASEVGIWSDDKAPESSHWVDKTVVDLDKDKIERLALSTPDRSVVFEKREKKVEGEEPEEGGKAAGAEAKEEKREEKEEEKKEYEWALAEGGPGVEFKKSGLDDVLKALDSFDATDVVDPAKKKEYGLDGPRFRCELRLEGGKEVVLLGAQEKPGEDAYLMVEGKDVVFKVSDWKFDDVFREGKDFFDLTGLSEDKDDVRGITLDYASERIAFARKGDKWEVSSPSTGLEFKEREAKDLADALAEWKPVDYADGESLEAFGLAAPERKVTFVVAKKGGDANKAAGRTHTISLGSEAKGTEGRYALLDDEKQVWIAGKWDVEKILPEPKDFYEMDVADIKKEDIARVVVDRAEAPFVLERGEGDRWKLSVGGAEVEADQDEVDTYVQRFSPVTASDVDLGRQSLDGEPAFALRVERKDGKTGLALRFGTDKEDDKRAAQFEGKAVVLLFSSSTVDDLAPPFGKLADLEVVDLPSGNIAKITVARDADAFELAREGEAWKMSVGGEEKACDAGAVSRYLRVFSGLKAADASAGAPELAPDEAGPAVIVTKKDGTAVTLRLGGQADGKVALRREGRPLVYLINKRGAAKLAPPSGSLASKDGEKEEKAPPASEKTSQQPKEEKEEAEAGAAKP